MNNRSSYGTRAEVASRLCFVFTVVLFVLWGDTVLNSRLHSSTQRYIYLAIGCVFIVIAIALRLYSRPRKILATELSTGKLSREAFSLKLSEHFIGDLNENDDCPYRVLCSLERVARTEFITMSFEVMIVKPVLIRDVIDILYNQYSSQYKP